jgi:hypothetical protein
MEFLVGIIILVFVIFWGYYNIKDLGYKHCPIQVVTNQYKNNKNNVIFTELIRYETESVMLRTDINVRLLIPHVELDKHYTKLDK